MGKKRNKVEIFKLEDRVLFEAGAVVQAAEAAAADQANNDAAGDGSAAAEMQSDNNQTASNELTPDNLAEMPVPPEMSGSDNADDTADADAADFAAADPESETVAFTDAPIAASETSERILVVLNSSVADADSIVNDLGDNVEVLRLEAGTDALDTINDYLDEHADTKYSAIHLVSHGSEGYITLNGEKIDSTTINPADWKAIGEHLTDDADILVYGCDTAKSEEGKALVQTIANLTGADVAASIDSTGATGDWDLEYRSGLIEAATLTPQYSGRLATEITVTIDGVNDFTELQTAITDVEAGGTIKFAVDTANFAKNMDANGDGTLDSYGIDITATLAISKNITINGWIDFDSDGVVDQGERIVFDGGDKFGQTVDGTEVTTHSGVRIMNISSGATVAIDGIQFQNAYSTANGGVISNAGTVTVSNSVFFNNSTTKYGVLLYNASTGVAVIDSSYAKNNAATSGGAVYNAGGVLALMNSTITGTTGADYVIYDAFGNNDSRTYVIGSTIVGNSVKGARLYNSLVINSIMANNGSEDLNSPSNVESKVLNSFYTSTNTYPKLIGSTKVTATADASTLMQLFGSDNPELSADGTLTPVFETVKDKTALQLRIKDTTVETDDGAGNITTSIRKDLQYHNGGTDADEDKNWTTIQAGTKITDEILARMDHDQLGHSRGTKTVGAVSLAEDPSIHTLVVNTTNGADAYDNLTSIEEAVAYANTLEGEQTITFAEGLAFNHDADGNGTADSYLININKTMELTKAGLVLTIDGADKLILDGGDKYDGTTVTEHSGYQIMTVAKNVTVNLSNLTLQNGFYLSNEGGAAILNKGTVTLNDVDLVSNFAQANGAHVHGGAIYNAGTMNIADSYVVDNTGAKFAGSSNWYIYGGAVYNKSGATLNVSGTTFENNEAIWGGGAIENNGTLNVSDSVFNENIGSSAQGNGGAILSSGSSATLTVSKSTFTGNIGRYSGAISVESGSKAFIVDSYFDGNKGGRGGGAVYGYHGTFTVMNSTFTNHTSGALGLFTQSSGTASALVINSTFYGNTGDITTTTANETFIVVNSISTSTIKAVSGATIELFNSIYNTTSGTVDVSSGDNTILTANEIFGSNTVQADGTIEPVHTAAIGKLAELSINADGDLVYGSTVVQTATTITDEQLANQTHDQNGNARATKTLGAASSKENLTSLVVNTTNGADAYDNLTSIEEAVAYADTLGGEQTITFAEGLAFNHDADGNGTADSYLININKTMELTASGLVLTIDGADKLILDGGDKYDGTTVTTHSGVQIFTVAADTTLNLSNLTLQNGFYLGNEGGAAILNKGTVTLNNVDVLSNFAEAGSAGHVLGSGIYNTGTMNVVDSYFADNTGAKFAGISNWFHKGGGIYNTGTLNVTGTTFEKNIGHWGGGAIHNMGTLNVADSIFKENHTVYNSIGNARGSAIASFGSGTVTITGSEFTGNSSTAVSFDEKTKGFIDSSFFTENSGSRGSALYVTQGSSAIVMNSTFANNTGDGAIGAFIQMADTTTSVLVINSTLYNNSQAIRAENYDGSLKVQIVNSILTNTIYANNANCSIELFNSIYNGKSDIASIDAESSGDNTLLTENEVFGSNTLQADGTIEPVHTTAIGKLAELSINADGDLVYGSTVVQTATTITDEQLANQTHDQNGNARATKTLGAASSKENLTSLVVNTTNGADAYDNLTSIEEAVAYADTLGGEQTITFAEGLAFNHDADGNGTADSYLININKTMELTASGLVLTIDGADKLILDGGDKYDGTTVTTHSGVQIFTVAEDTTLNLSNTTLQNGYLLHSGDHYAGAAIRNRGTVTLNHVNVLNNYTAAESWAEGAAISNGGNLTVIDSLFSGNVGEKADSASTVELKGGAIGHIGGKLVISGSTFENNSISHYGGAIYSNVVSDDAVTITDSVFRNNTAMRGGAIQLATSGAAITGSTFTGNKAAATYGSAIYAMGAKNLLVNQSYFGDNTTSAAVYLSSDINASFMNSTFANNAVGGISMESRATGLVLNSTFYNNGNDISYLETSNALTIVNSIVTGKIFLRNDAVVNMYNSIYNTKTGDGTLNAVDSTISTAGEVFGSNTLQADGTIEPVHTDAIGKLAELSINADGDLVYGSTVVQTATTITNEQLANQTHDQNGNSRGTKTIGAVSAKENLTSLVVNTTNGADAYDNLTSIEEAVAYANTLTGTQTVTFAQDLAFNYDADGDGDNESYLINLNKSMTVNKSGLTLTIDGAIGENKVTLDAGSKFRHFNFSNAVITLQNMTLQNGYVSNANGGSIYNTSNLTIDNVSFIGNKQVRTVNDKDGFGGAIYSKGVLEIKNSEFINNSTTLPSTLTTRPDKVAGGAIYSTNTTTITDSYFDGNTAYHNGGAVYVSGTLNVYDTTFKGNKAQSSYGGAIYSSSTLTVNGSFFDGNDSSGRGDGIFTNKNAWIMNSTFVNHGDGGAVVSVGTANGSKTTIIGSTFLNNTYGVHFFQNSYDVVSVDIYNSILADKIYFRIGNITEGSYLKIVNTIYTTIGNSGKSYSSLFDTTTGVNLQSTAADIFGSNTVQADGTIMPVLDAALGGALQLRVKDGNLQYHNGGTDVDDDKNWTTLQEGTLATNEQVTHDQLGNGRGTKTLGAVSAKETASLTVNSAGSAIDAYDGVITLNEAIAYAAADAAAVKGGAASAFAGAGFADNQYTINFADTITQITVDSTIRLEKGAFQSHGLVIDGTRTDGGKVILDGGATVTFNADGTFASHDGNGVRILHISENNNITLNNLIFQNAYSSTAGSAAGAGGAVYFEKGGTLCVNDSIFRKNAVNDQGGRGGAAIAAVGGTLLIDNSLFEQNVSIRAASGSAILTVTTTTITNSTIRSNYNAGSTGTIMTQGNTLNLINTTITGNYGTDNTAIQSYWTAQTTINLINSTVTGNIASSATAKGVIGYNATPENTYTVLNVINSIVAGNTGGDIALGSRSGSALNVINSVYGTINTTVANTPVNSVAETDLSQIFEIVSDGKAVATTQTVNGVMHDVFALKKDGIAAQNGALVGKLNGAYYYMDNGKWFALDGTEKAAFALDADTGYGLGADATIYSTAQNVDNAKTPVDRLYALKAENAEIIQIGAYAFNFIPNSEAKSLVVNLADDVVNGSDEKTSLREALSYAASLGGSQTITFDSTVFGDGATIVLDSAKGEIELTSNITIDGDVNADGKADVTIDGNNATRIFLINSEIAVNLQNLNLINGNVANLGAGIYLNNSNAVLTIDNVLFEGNAASGTQQSGGAIGVSRGTIVISDSVFRNNSATGSGAAISMVIGGDLTVTNTLFDGNTSSYHGATIYGAGYSNIYLNSITVMNSIGRGAYGAAVLLQGSSVIANSTFINNSVTQASAAAGAIELRGGHTQIFGSTFYTELVPYANQAAQIAVSETATLDLVNSVVASVSGTEAFKVADTATLNLYGVKYTGTQAAAAGSTLIADADLGKHFTLVDGKVAIATKTVNGVTHSYLMPLNNTGGATVTLTDSGSDSAPDMITIAQDGVSTAVIELVRNDLAADVFTKDQFGRERGTAKTAGSVIYTVEDPSLVVNTTLDVTNAYDGLTSLREAIAYLNQNGTLNGENTITFAESLSGETITLSSKIGNITKSMTINGDINGDGTADVTVDAAQKGYFFDLTTADMEFTLNGLILTNSSYTAGANGGAINLKANGITLNVIDSRIENSTNTRNGATLFIEKTGAEVNIIDSVFNGNTASWTGAVVFVSSVADFELNVSGSTISNNIIKGTTTHSDGGAIFVSGVTNAKVTITDSVFENNKGTGANGDAGISGGAFAYYNTNKTAHAEITITGSQFTDNRGASGGALSLVGKMTALLDDNTFTDNSSRAAGGAIYHGGYQADVTISNSIFTGNHADGTERNNHGGGAIFISSMDNSAATTSVQILNNTFTGNSTAAAGGALAVRKSYHNGGNNGNISFGSSSTTFLIHGENLTFKDNSAEYGGALLLHADKKSYIEFTNSLFDGNTATKTGGAIHLTATYNDQGFTANLHGLTIINNSAGYSGGAIAIAERADLYLSYSTVVGNRLTTTGKTIGAEDTSAGTAYFGGAGIYKGKAYRLDNNNDPGQEVYLIHNIITDNTLESNGSIVAHDIYSRNGVSYSVANIYSVGAGVTKIGGMDYVDADYAALASALFAPKVADKYVVDSNGLLQVNELTDETLNTAVNRNGFQLGTYQSGTYGQVICYSVDGGLSWNDAKGVAYTGELLNIYMADQTDGARVPYSTAGAAQYKPALMWSKADDGTITHWFTIADAKTQLESGSGEYFFAPTMQDFGDVAVNGSLILHGYNPDSELKINLILDSATDAVTVDGMKFTGDATLTAGSSMTIENALLTGEGDLAVTNGVLTILNSTVYNFGGTITIDAANGIGQIVNSTLYGNSGTITGNDKLNILNSLVFGTENLSGYTAKYSVFDGAGTAATNTYSASADDVFGTELVWNGLILTALQASPNSTAPHVNGAYVAMNGTNLYYSNDKVNWKNFADDSAATVDDAYIIKTDGLGNTRVVINGKAVAGAYSSLKEAGSLTVTIAADIVDPYDELISLREAIQYLKDGYRDANGETVITFDLDAIKAATGKYAYRTLTDGSIRIDVTSLEEGSADTAFNVASGVSYTIDGQDTGLIIDISLLGKNRRLFYVNGGTLTLKNITLYGSGSNDSTGELDLGDSTRYDNISGSIICVNAGNLNADHVTFARSNHSMHGNNNNGGAALWLTSGVATVTNSTFRDNYGISVKVRGNGKHVLDGITFTGNTGKDDHGLIEHHDNGANVTYRNFTITGNTIPHVFFSHRGEPIYASDFVIYDNTFKSHVFRCHGAASLYNMTVTDNNIITGSVFQFDHGTGNAITQEVYNSTVAGNYGNISAIVNITGGNDGSVVAVFDNTFAGNVSTNTAFASVYSDSTVTKSIFIANNIFANDAVMNGVGEAGKTYYGTAYDINVAAPKTYLFHNITGGKYSDAMTVTIDASNITGTYAELFGTQTPVLDVENGVHTLAISKDGAAATAGVLVGKIGNAYYFVRDGVWHKADGTVYQIDDGTGTMVDVALTNDAATNYGLGTKSGTVVYTLGKNSVADGNGVYNVTRVETLEQFNAGSHILNADVYTDPLVVNGTGGVYNRFDGSNSLHEALAYANKTEGAQTITFDSTVFTDTTTEYVIDLVTTLLVTDAVTISNTTGTKIVLNGGNTIRVMEVGAATTIDGLIFRNGYMEGDLRTNANDQLYGGGGAIFAEAALTVKNSTFENNSYKDTTKTAWYLGGGAIFAIADVTVENSSFTGNYVNTSAKSVYDGGSAIHIVKAGLNVVNSTFQNHVSGTKSGVVMSTSGTGLTITDSTISGNTMHGVHLAYSSGTQTIKGTTFSNNSHTYAAAIQASISGLLTVNDCTFTGNTSTGTYGGVVKYNGNGTLSITDSTFENNISTGNTKDYSAGGAVYYSGAGELTISGSTFTGNQVTKATNPVGGGAIYANFSKSGSMTVTDSTFSGNSTGTRGGAIYLALANGSATITNNTFTDNTATGNGGAIYLSNTSGTNVLADNTFTDNSAAAGGAIYIAAGETSITGSTFKGNSAVGDGGALHTAADTTISNSIFGSTTEGEGNSGAHGMTIYQAGGAMVITNSSIVGSTSTTQWADIGAIHANGTSLALYGVQITDNKANGSFSNNNGGGVVVKSGTLTVDSYIDPTTSAETKTTIARNLAGTHGGGIYFAANTSGTIKNAVFDSNTGAVGGGGAIYGATGTTISIENTHFNNNSASGWGSANGGAINFAGTSLTIKNSLFSGNGATHSWNDGQAPDSGGGAIYVSAGTVDVINSTFYNNLGRVGNGFQVTGGTVNLVNSTMYSTETTSSVEITGGTFNAINSIVSGTVNGTLNNINSVVGADAADIFTSTTLTADNTLEIKADGAAAIAGTLVGRKDGTFYYLDVVNSTWKKLGGTDADNLAFNASDTSAYGLTDGEVYTIALNNVSRVATLLQFNAGSHAIQPGAVSTVVTDGGDVTNLFDDKITLREALDFAAAGGTVTFDSTVTSVTLANGLGINKSVTVDAGTGVEVGGGALTIADAATLTVAGSLTLAPTSSLSGGNVTVSTGAALTANGNFKTGTLTNSGSLILAGAENEFTSTNAGKVSYTGTADQQVVSTAYSDLVLSGSGIKTANGAVSATTTTVNSGATLDVNGDFAGGTLTNNGSLNLAGANNTATGTLGNVTYDGATQQVIAGDYGNLTISSTGTATANGDLTATTTTVNSGATLDVNGNFAGGTVNNTGAMTLSGASNTGSGTLGDVTYDGAGDQAIIAGDYGDLTISSTGKATATGDITAAMVDNNANTEVTGNLTATGDLASTAALTVGGNLTAATTDNSSDLKVSGNYTAATTDNSATLDVNGNFAGGAVTNSGSMTLSGATNSGTGTLGDVTYDGTANQQIIAAETYGDLIISTTGTATVNGNLKAETTTNSATLDVNGNFAGGAVTNTGSMTLSGASNSGTGTLGDVTYDGADQQVIAGTYGDLTINSTGKATATGNISAAAVDNNANTEVTGNLTTTGDLESAAALKVGGSVDAANITTTGEMEVADNLTASGTVDSDAALTVGGNFSAATTTNSSDLTVTGNYTADTTTTSGTLDVNGNFAGGDVTNTGSMSLAGANNTANAGSTLGDVTYNGTADQEVIAGTYEDLVISTTGKATATGDISAATVKSDAETAITGDLTATGNITSNGDMDVTGNLTATGDLASTAALTVGGNASANNATLSGDTAITGDLTATGTVDSDAALTVGGNLTADTTDNSSDLTVGGTFTANTTNNSGTLDAEGDLNAGALTNSGNISVAGTFATTSTDLGAVEYDGTAAQNVVGGTYSDLSLTGGDKALAGAVTVTDSLTADANIDTAGQDLTLSGDVAGSGTISTTTDSGTVTYDGADQNVLAGAYNNLALANGTKTLNSANTTTVNDTFTATGTTIQSDTADVLASLTVKDAGDDSTPSSAIAGTTFNGIALNNTGSADGYLYVNADTNNADDATTGVYLVGNVFVAANGIIYGDTLGEVYITVTNGNGDVISEGTADDLGWTWAVGNDAIENATTGTAYELVSKAGYKFRFHGDVDVVIGKRAITVKADDLEIDTGDDPVFTYTYVGELVGSDAFTGELASEGDGSQPGDFAITQGTLSLGDNYELTFIGGTLTVEGGGQDAHQFPNYNNPGNFAGVYDAPVHSTTHSYDHHESVPTLEHQNDRSIGFLFSVSNKQLGDASGAFGDNAPQSADVNIHAHTLSDLLKSYDKSEQIIASPANEIEDAKDDMKDLHDFSNNPFGILPDDEDLHTRAYDESIDFTVIGEDNLSTAKAEQFKDEFDAALEELLSLV